MAFSFSFRRTKNHANEFLSRTYSFAHLSRYLHKLILFAYRFSAFHLSPFLIYLLYFVSLAVLGSLLLILLKPGNPNFTPGYVDMLFMSTSALTVSGLGVVEMENLSSAQIVVLTLLMFLGGEVFLGLLSLLFRRAQQDTPERSFSRVDSVAIELEPVDLSHNINIGHIESGINPPATASAATVETKDLRPSCVRYLGYVVSGYIATFHLFGTSLLLAYFAGVSKARGVLKTKGINIFLFCLSTTVSSFANAGFIATTENMAVFNRDPVILLLMTAQILAGNTLFPLFLRWAMSSLRKLTKCEEFEHMLKNSGGAEYNPLLSKSNTILLSLTIVGLMAALLALFCAMDWTGAVFDGLTSVEKFVSALFMAVNSRHAGENSIDCSLISPAVLVFLIVMMYLPPTMSISLDQEDESSCDAIKKKKKNSLVQNWIFSQISCIVVFIIAVCITERRKMTRDPINFSTLNMIFEVTSAYGNVGLSAGYSCSRLLKLPGASCEDKTYSLSGWWSVEGKLILALVMIYGRLKAFSAGCGKAWKLYRANE